MVNNGHFMPNHSNANPISIAPLSFKHSADERLGIEMLSIAQLRQRAPISALSRVSRANFYRLISVTSGQTCPWIDFNPVPAKQGDCLLIKPGQVFRHDFANPWNGDMVVFRPERLYFATSGLGLDLAFSSRIDRLPVNASLSKAAWEELSAALKKMQNDSTQVSDFPTLQSLLQLQLSYLLLHLCMAQELSFDSEKSAGRALVHFERFKIQLEKDFTTKHQVQHFGDALGLSVKILNRACLSSTGYSTKSCINQRIALEAKRLLAHTDAAVQSIAIDLGFDDPTNFVKFFKREAAMTPGQFRLSQVSMGN